MSVLDQDWTAPGPGRWERDESHQSAPFCRYMTELASAHLGAGMNEASARYGLLVEMEFAEMNSWLYARIKPVGAPDKPGDLPPRWLFKAIVALHPALRRRTGAARRALAANLWRKDADEWVAGRDGMRRRLLTLQAVELRSLDDPSLLRHIEAVRAATIEGFRIHFRNAIAHWIGVGDWLNHCRAWTGEEPVQAMLALKGASPYSIDTVAYVDRIAAVAKGIPAALEALEGTGDAATRLAALSDAAPPVRQALDDYLTEHGRRLFTGFDLLERTLIEMPETILESIRVRLGSSGAPDTGAAYAAALRSRVPSQHRDEYDSLYHTATALYGVRDDDVGPCFQWPLGLLRLALLEAGRRLAAQGRLKAPDDIFEAGHGELRALLSGAPGAVAAGELAARTAHRIAMIADVPPSVFGPDDGPPPPSDWLPPAVARVNDAMMAGMAVEMAGGEPGAPTAEAAEKTVSGFAASSGTATGRARLVSGPDDFGKLHQGDILVAPFTTPAYNVVLPMLAGVVTDKGGILSHAAIVAREFAIPAVVGCGDATRRIEDGALLRIDGAAGLVEILERAAAPV
jgi:pyruvate,water dikinase